MGEKLARQDPARAGADHDIDVVIPIPDTSRPAALQLANRLGVQYREGFIKNRYIGRTFIMPGQQSRRKSVRQKLNAIDLEFKGKNVLLVDDSIVRGTTSPADRADGARGGRAPRSTSRRPRRRCASPTSTASTCRPPSELVAHGRTEEEIGASIGADGLVYQDLDDLIEAVRRRARPTSSGSTPRSSTAST